MRPIRLYLLTFVNRLHPEQPARDYARTGHSPCAAKQAGFLALEQDLAKLGLPRQGWQLVKQEDITHRVSA